MTVRENAMREARGFEIRAWNAETRSNQAKAEGKAAMVGAIFDAGANLLSSAQQFRKMQAPRRAGSVSSSGGGHNLSGGSSYRYFGG
jgi:hypothetical protein